MKKLEEFLQRFIFIFFLVYLYIFYINSLFNHNFINNVIILLGDDYEY